MKSFAQTSDPNALLTELKQLIQSPATPQPSVPNSKPASTTGFRSPIHGDWKNAGDFNLSMKRHHGGTGHSGIDMSISGGTPIYSFGSGIVNKVGSNDLGGNVVGIQHDKNTWSYYAHLATIKVQEGDKVDTNTVIGTVGNTGNARSSWPHLHFGVKVNGSWVNPAQFFNVPKYDHTFANNPQKFQKQWLSEQSKQDAKNFNVADHKRKDSDGTRLAQPSRNVDDIVKLAEYFYKLAIK